MYRPVPEWADPQVPAETLDAQGLSRRGLIRRAGLFGAAFAAASLASPARAATPAAEGNGRAPDLVYLVGDHHNHSVYSHDAKYTFSQLAAAGQKFGLDWMVFTEHSNIGHVDFGAALEHQEILRARADNKRMLIFQGLEWYIPGAEHCTVFSPPGRHEVELLTRFEKAFDGKLLGYTMRRPGPPRHPAERGARGEGPQVAGRAAPYRIRRRRTRPRQPSDASGDRLPARDARLA